MKRNEKKKKQQQTMMSIIFIGMINEPIIKYSHTLLPSYVASSQ